MSHSVSCLNSSVYPIYLSIISSDSILFLSWLSTSLCQLFLSSAFLSFSFIALGYLSSICHLFSLFSSPLSCLLHFVSYHITYLFSFFSFILSRLLSFVFLTVSPWFCLINFSLTSFSTSNHLVFSVLLTCLILFTSVFPPVLSHPISFQLTSSMSLSTFFLSFNLLSSRLFLFFLSLFKLQTTTENRASVYHGVSNPSLCLWPTTVNHIFICGNPIQAESLWVAKRGLSGPLDSRTPSMNLNRSVQWKFKEKWAKSWGWVGMFSWMRHSGHFRVKNVDLILKMCFILSGSEVANHYAQLCNHFSFFRGFEYTLCAVLELWCSLSTIIAVNLCFLQNPLYYFPQNCPKSQCFTYQGQLLILALEIDLTERAMEHLNSCSFVSCRGTFWFGCGDCWLSPCISRVSLAFD